MPSYTEEEKYAPPTSSRITDVAAWISLSRDQYTEDYQLDQIDREEGSSDNSFAFSTDASMSQWSAEALQNRRGGQDGRGPKRPVLQSNRLPIYMRHVTNAGRQNKPEIKVSAGDGGSDETAQMYEARIRQLLYECKADIARDTARDQQVASGRGFVRVTTRIIPGTKKEVAWVERIENQFSVIPGPHREYDCSDAPRMWVVTLITKQEHKRRWPNAYLSAGDFAPFQGEAEWVGLGPRGEMIQIAEKFEKHFDNAEDREECTGICQYIINGREILEENDLITNDMPIVPQWGFECVIDGIKRHISLINPAKSDQRLVNLYVSNIAENIAKQPKNRYSAAFGSIAAHHEDAYVGNDPKGILYYKAFDEDNRPLPPPQMDSWEPPIEALSAGLQQAIEGIKSTMGIFDASIGQRSNETSGIAINRRKVEGETINYHFPDNEARTWDRVGQILIKMIDVLDADKDKVPIRHENGKTEMVPIGKPYKHPKSGKIVTHEFDANAYTLHIDQGLSYNNAREEAAAGQQAIIQAAPDLMYTGVGVDLIRNSGWPGADETADALTRFINMRTPGLIPDENTQQIPQQALATIQGLQKQLQTTQAFAQSLHQQIQTKQVEQQGKLQIDQADNATKLQIAQMQEETKRVIELAKLQSQEALAKLEAELKITHNGVEMAHEERLQRLDHSHEMAKQSLDQAHQANQQAETQEFQGQQSDADREAAQQQATSQEGDQ